ncbi:hypothetical protein CH367_18125 [Leptospira barantonii]|uniref:YcxB-like C-terminal domain-containing protein n=1 Tax=Leptospira barantonii TaxID=2023184 RepID=A0ABX4NLC1_9LEPT|nr:hypothetical protein CH367_18125 [Leptospira barantonii]
MIPTILPAGFLVQRGNENSESLEKNRVEIKENKNGSRTDWNEVFGISKKENYFLFFEYSRMRIYKKAFGNSESLREIRFYSS